MTEPGDILNEEWLVQTKFMAQRRGSLRRGLLPQDHSDRVAWDQVNQPEHHNRDQQQDREAEDEPADDKSEHRSALLSGRSRYFTTKSPKVCGRRYCFLSSPIVRMIPSGTYVNPEILALIPNRLFWWYRNMYGSSSCRICMTSS